MTCLTGQGPIKLWHDLCKGTFNLGGSLDCSDWVTRETLSLALAGRREDSLRISSQLLIADPTQSWSSAVASQPHATPLPCRNSTPPPFLSWEYFGDICVEISFLLHQE